MQEKCETCRYWKQTREMLGGGLDEDAGECRFYPPQVGIIGTVGEMKPLTAFPTTKKSSWCGKWQAAVEKRIIL